jgi:hypothetical protein
MHWLYWFAFLTGLLFGVFTGAALAAIAGYARLRRRIRSSDQPFLRPGMTVGGKPVGGPIHGAK